MADLNDNIPLSRGLRAISPIIVFLIVYLLTSIIIGDFYKMPIGLALLIASIWGAMCINGSIAEKIETFSKGAGSSNIMYMVWIFILAGVFAAIAEKSGAVKATVDVALTALPSYLIVPGLFVATCFISMAIGTSVGTVVAIVPLAADIAASTGGEVAFYVAIVLGGAFFGDNLSFISDTTIAATRTQGCDMRHKFSANLKIVLPAAIIALALYCCMSQDSMIAEASSPESYWLVLPYLIVIALALCGINVIIVLLCGIFAAITAGLLRGMSLIEILSIAGSGIDTVGNLIIITLLAAGMLGMIKHAGGIDFILNILGKNTGTQRGAQLCIVLLVGIVNLCTANNTVAIITVGSMARKIASSYHILPRKAASLLDTGSCVVQALIPYGAQTLMATSLAGISPVAPWQYLYYPQILIVCLGISILLTRKSDTDSKNKSGL